MKKEIFRMERVTFENGGVHKLSNLSFNIFEGEILGLLPVNSGGLSALIQLLKTNLPLYDGYVYYNEILVNSWKNPRKLANRITVIQDKSSLVGDLTVCDNIFVLRQNFRGEIISRKRLERQLVPFLAEIQMNIPAKVLVDKLGRFERVVVEILKGVVAGHRLIVLNQIQTLITDKELEKLHQIMDFYTGKGISFLYISVHFEDILPICHRAVFFQNGSIAKVLQRHQLTMDNLVVNLAPYQAMVENYNQTREGAKGNCQLSLRHTFRSATCTLELEMQQPQCVVVQCLDNQMYGELTQVLQEQTIPPDGHLALNGQRVTSFSRDFAIIGEHPSKTMLFPQLSCLDNLCFNLSHRVKGLWLKGSIRKSVEHEYAPHFGHLFHLPVDRLTEQEKYKLVYSRIALQKPKFVFCIQPFKGADLGLRMYIFTLLETLLRAGIGVVILSINLADTLSIADRLICIQPDQPQTEYLRHQFKYIQSAAPWKNI